MATSSPHKQSGNCLIEAKGLSKSFGAVKVLENVDLAVKEGEVVSVIGPSGSGKTTLLRCFALLEQPSDGAVIMRDKTIASPALPGEARQNAKAARGDIGMVFQHFNLWPHFNVLQNIVEAPIRVKGETRAVAEANAMRLLEKVGLSDKRDSYPSRLSGGQQQRVAIARALAMKPSVMLFDEATSALDPELKHEVLLVMRGLAEEGMTMLVVTHEMSFARNVGSRVIFMDQGQVVEDADPVAFFGNPKTDRAQRFLRQMQD
ncbi:amino acid ABC transporter ATP-binding protein (plasmid) [Aquamicrobium terrae]